MTNQHMGFEVSKPNGENFPKDVALANQDYTVNNPNGLMLCFSSCSERYLEPVEEIKRKKTRLREEREEITRKVQPSVSVQAPILVSIEFFP